MNDASMTLTEGNSAVAAEGTQKKKWVEPEITWHKELQGITLAVQCQVSQPPCTSPAVNLF
jgi:hypothetical protein